MTDRHEQLLQAYAEKINEELLKFTENKPELQSSVLEAMEYSLSAGGKRLRPVLILEFYRMCGGEDIDKMVKLACAVELIHTYSLIHDDLPCMDNDDFRRGKPSCHKAFSEEIALLAGDALNTLAFEVITDCAMEGTISAETAVMLISVLSKAIGTDGMIGGQVSQCTSPKHPVSCIEPGLETHFIYDIIHVSVKLLATQHSMWNLSSPPGIEPEFPELEA